MAEQKTQSEILKAVVKKGYKQAGIEFLAYRLSRLIRPIDNEVDKVLFNEIAGEIRLLIGKNTDLFLKNTAETILQMASVGMQERKDGKEKEFKR